VDSSAAAIACQALLRLGRHLEGAGRAEAGPHPAPCASTYTQAGLTVLARLLEEPYLSTAPDHQGLILHSIYHRPNNWDHTPPGSRIPRGEASMWGDYHMREAALLVQRALLGRPHYTFFSTKKGTTA
jgi:unsaturated chondroitin disaccharide hydrolase